MKNVKRFIGLIVFPAFLIGTGITISSCSSSDSDPEPAYTCLTCHDTPDALAANDGSIKGIYKGIVVGSTGTISINIQNGSSTITATMVLDGVSIALTSTVSVTEDVTYVAPFTGMYNGSPISITFQVGSGGGSPTMVSSDIPGHPNTVFTLYKETSTSLIEAFEGSVVNVTNSDTGTFNFIVARSISKWGYIVKPSDPSNPISTGGGIIVGNDLMEESHNIGTINGDLIHGSFVDNNSQTIHIDGHRTL